MGKIEEYTKNRMEGLVWALKIIDQAENLEDGVDNLRKEVRFRNASFIPLEIPAYKIRECSRLLAKRVLSTVLVMVIKVLDDEYGWKRQRLQTFIERFSRHTVGFDDIDPYGDRYAEMSDYAEYFKEQYGIVFSDDQIDEMKSIEDENRKVPFKRVQTDVIEKHLKNRYPEALEYLKEVVGF